MVYEKEDLHNAAVALLLLAGVELLERLDLYLEERRNALQRHIEYRHMRNTSVTLPSYEHIALLPLQTERGDERERYIPS